MIKRLTRHGNSLALVIDRAVLELLKINGETPLEISTDGRMLFISPMREKAREKKFRKALEETNKKYGPALKRLAE